MLDLALQNLLSPMILSFGLGLAAALARSDLSIPEAVAKGLSIYLLFAIGFKGGVSLNEAGLDARAGGALALGVALSAGMPVAAFALLALLTRLGPTDRAAVAAHYGSISIVTFVTAISVLDAASVAHDGFMVAVAAAMEAPAILTALWLAARAGGLSSAPGPDGPGAHGLWREILLNGSIVLLLGAFLIGWITGPAGMAEIDGFITVPFKGILCLFLLDMGLVAGRNLRAARGVMTPELVVFGVVMPLVGSVLGLVAGLLLGLQPGSVALFAVLAASASYIAVPAAMRVALPQADPGVYLTLSLGVTFPFNLTVGIPLYLGAATLLAGG